MLFNSYIFIFLFLPLTLLIYFFANHLKKYNLAQAFLLCASIVFYGYFNTSYVWIIVSSILLNYTISKLLHKVSLQPARKALLIFALLSNLGMFMYFKYFDFFIININTIFATDFTLKNILLPLGISFFTFQQVSYIVDSYRNEVPDYSFLHYGTFVAFFPQLIAGPIVLHNEIVPQFLDIKKKRFNFDNFSRGLKAFVFGLAKKVIIADLFGRVVAAGYKDISGLTSISSILLILSYTIQIYFDFSGYCDMATGIGLMFNINITQNFNSPYKAYTITEFWQRWHITLTRFFKKYLYFPLGGNRKGKIRTYVNIFIVFLVSGFWHGANFTFILWGALHGVANIVTKIFSKRINKLHSAFNWIVTFIFINITWVYFRAPSIGVANTIILKAASLGGGSISGEMLSAFRPSFLITVLTSINQTFALLNSMPRTLYMILYMGFAMVALLCMKNTNERIDKFKPTIYSSIVVSALLVISIISLSSVSTFLYFNF